jgi:hypothetical protein
MYKPFTWINMVAAILYSLMGPKQSPKLTYFLEISEEDHAGQHSPRTHVLRNL